MVKLFEFKPGTLILSSEVNSNFNQFVDIIGVRSNDDQLVLPGRISFGERQAATISALTDRAEANNAYLHLGWNAKEVFNKDASVGVARSVNNEGAAFLRVGTRGFSVFGTTDTSGNLIPNRMRLFEINTNKYIYVHPKWSFSNSAGKPAALDDYRLTLSPLTTPVEVLSIGKNAEYDAVKEINLSIPNYHGVELFITARRRNANDLPPLIVIKGNGMDDRSGFKTRMYDTGTSIWQGRAFFSRTNGNTETKLKISVNNTINALSVAVTGVWK